MDKEQEKEIISGSQIKCTASDCCQAQAEEEKKIEDPENGEEIIQKAVKRGRFQKKKKKKDY